MNYLFIGKANQKTGIGAGNMETLRLYAGFTAP